MKTLRKNFILSGLMAAMLAGVPAAAAAQGRVPTTDSGAVGGDVGIFLARDADLNNGLALEGFYEYYFTPRVSVRTGLGWANPQYHDNRDPDASLRMIRVAVDLIHNWEGGNVHPFVGAGIGTYFLQRRNAGQNFGESETKLGGTLLGGVEIFTSPTLAIKAEGRYHIVPQAFGILDPDGFALTVGVKKYF
jgi:opacity protein-like surface antigen